MTITYKEWFFLYLGARTYDDHHWPQLRMEKWLMDNYAFGDDGVHYVRGERKEAGA